MRTPDFAVHGKPGDTVFLLEPLSQLASEWIEENLPNDASWFGRSVAVEHRYITDIVTGIRADGLIVQT